MTDKSLILTQLSDTMQSTCETAYIFQCGEEALFAVSKDASGDNIPRSSCTQGWLLRERFLLKDRTVALNVVVQEAMRRGINDKGFYIWRAEI